MSMESFCKQSGIVSIKRIDNFSPTSPAYIFILEFNHDECEIPFYRRKLQENLDKVFNDPIEVHTPKTFEERYKKSSDEITITEDLKLKSLADFDYQDFAAEVRASVSHTVLV